MQCPFVDAKGKQCEGEILGASQDVRMQLQWIITPVGWEESDPDITSKLTPITLECNLKGHHVDRSGNTAPALKVWELPKLS